MRYPTAWFRDAGYGVASNSADLFKTVDGKNRRLLQENTWASRNPPDVSAGLPIRNAPSAETPVKLYVGRSADTDRLGITDEGLKHGAFKMLSGRNFLALVGHDSEFRMPRLVRHSARDTARAQADWDEATGAKWSLPYGQVYKGGGGPFGMHEKDERGYSEFSG